MLGFADPDEIRIILCKDTVLYFFYVNDPLKIIMTQVAVISGFAPAYSGYMNLR